ncbi:hypothetical protein MSAN_00590500 [Mycena sanguinolenta]|uniref:BTB domain-containing protein n=1 Tax=Mycena sanguinolenta TaxID=230812 RepID=A0A8H6Z753_9AGAR|nr:hypothetical protein MSAN_00590500 [Mycena sanguinolenta]
MACASFSMDIVTPEENLDGMPLVKRRRVSNYARSCEATQSGVSSRQCTILKSLWFPDGDIVLEIEQRLLKVHRKRLRCSVIFSDMLHIPQPSETDQVDGCPSVTLVGDAVTDWEVALEWIYSIDDFLRKPTTFDVLSGALRISTKYEIGDLRCWAIQELLLRWPVDVASMRLNALPHAAEAINLAQECNVPEILPSCFYALSVQKFHCSADGGRSHIVLSPNDLRRLIAGREALQDVLLRIVIDPLTEPGCSNNNSRSCGCDPRRIEYWRTRLAPDPKSPWSTWLARELIQMLDDGAFTSSLCSDCLHAHLSTVRWRLGRLRGNIPSFFLL